MRGTPQNTSIRKKTKPCHRPCRLLRIQGDSQSYSEGEEDHLGAAKVHLSSPFFLFLLPPNCCLLIAWDLRWAGRRCSGGIGWHILWWAYLFFALAALWLRISEPGVHSPGPCQDPYRLHTLPAHSCIEGWAPTPTPMPLA